MTLSIAEHLFMSLGRRAFAACFAVSLILVSGCYQKDDGSGVKVPPAVVKLGKAEVRDVTIPYETTGRTDMDPVNIVPRVRGYIEEVCFSAGDIVEAGDILYRIEDFDYKVAVATAKADTEIAVALADRAKADYDRQLGLNEKGKGFTTQEDIDRTKALYNEAVGKIDVAKANLAQMQKDLERTVIKAPCRGKINRTLVTEGNLVDGTSVNPPLLTTLMPMDPMYVYFEITDAEFQELNKRIIEAVKEALGDKFDPTKPLDNNAARDLLEKNKGVKNIEVEMRLPGDPAGEYPNKGILTYSENLVNRGTGSITLRAEFSNPTYAIFPGNICNVRINSNVLAGAVVVKEKSLCYDLSDTYIWVLDENGKPKRQNIVLGDQVGRDERIVASGLTGNETYIVDGTQKVRAGCDIQELSDNPAPAESSQPAAAAE